MNKFKQVQEKNFKNLELYVPVVARVHGGTHPEFYKVQRLFNEISGKIKEAGADKPELEQEFAELRQVTADYTVPNDVCESYEAVYKMLEELDQAYQIK